MSFTPRFPLTAKGKVLQVLSVERISTEHQDEKSLVDQQQQSREFVTANYTDPVEWKSIASRGSGEILDRLEFRQLEDEIDSGKYDLVVVEDLGRICRRIDAVKICELCEDCDTRLIALNDSVDTHDDDWQMSAFFSVLRHEKYNEDTSKRIRRTLRHRFTNGLVFQCPVYGYLKAPGATDAEVQKDPTAEAVYNQWFDLLEQGASYSEVADWLNAEGVPTGPYCRAVKWTCKMVARVTTNPILKGQRLRNVRMSRRINKTGRRKSVKAPPEELLVRECPHLAFIEPSRWDHVTHMLKVRNANYRRGKVTGIDPRLGIPKKRTRWPGQHVRCGLCGRILTYSGSSDVGHLMCSGAVEYHCWNSLAIHGATTARIVAERLLQEIERLPGFDAELLASVQEKLETWDDQRGRRRSELEARIATLAGELRRLINTARHTESETVYELIREAESEKKSLEYELAEFQRSQPQAPEIPDLGSLKVLARSQLAALAPDSQEFARLMRRLIPEMHVFPYRLLDGGHPETRAHVRFDLRALIGDVGDIEELQRHLSGEFVVNLFEPPQREAYRTRIVELANSPIEKLSSKKIAKRLGITQPPVLTALALQRQMDAAGRIDPYVPLREPPADYGKLRRYRHKRYQFEPLAGYPREWPTD